MRQRYKNGVGNYADLQRDIRSYLAKIDDLEELELSILSNLADILDFLGKGRFYRFVHQLN